MEEVLQFHWEVHEKGYKWVDTKAVSMDDVETKPPYITSGVPIGMEYMITRYSPLHLYRGLFRTFAETKPTKDSILDFANKYGLLLGNEGTAIELEYEDQISIGMGEPLEAWVKEIRLMSKAVELWDWATARDEDRLRKYIRWRESNNGNAVMYVDETQGADGTIYPREYAMIAASEPKYRTELLGRFPKGDVVTPALYRVQEVINKALENRIAPRLLWNMKTVRLGIYLMPKNLIGALWLQFTQAIDGDKSYRRCQECRNWIELSPDTARSNKKFCSDACRIRAHRRRHKTEVSS